MPQVIQQENNKKKILQILTVLFGSFLIGLSPVFVRLSSMEPVSVGFYRLFLSLPILLVWMAFTKKNQKKDSFRMGKKHLWMLLGGVFFAFDIGLWNLSLKHTSVANSSLFNNFAAFFVPLMAWLFYAARPKVRFIFTLCLAFIGSFLLTSGEGFSLQFTSGDLLALISAVAFGSYIMTMSKLRRESLTTRELLFWKGISCSLLLGLMALFMGESLIPPNIKEWSLLFSIAIFIQVLGQGLLVFTLGKLSPAVAAVTLLAAPITSVFMAWILFSEHLSMTKIIGAAIILSSIFLLQVDEKKKAANSLK
ncbi:MAG: DMT family transporter [Simkaniaceae bacterium]